MPGVPETVTAGPPPCLEGAESARVSDRQPPPPHPRGVLGCPSFVARAPSPWWGKFFHYRLWAMVFATLRCLLYCSLSCTPSMSFMSFMT